MPDLLELAIRCEKAKGSDRLLDRDIAVATLFDFVDGWIDAPDFTCSLNAAESLKHRADLWCVGSMEDGPFARVIPAMPGGHYGAEITTHGETVEGALVSAFLRATALRARAAMEKERS